MTSDEVGRMAGLAGALLIATSLSLTGRLGLVTGMAGLGSGVVSVFFKAQAMPVGELDMAAKIMGLVVGGCLVGAGTIKNESTLMVVGCAGIVFGILGCILRYHAGW